MLSQNGNDDAIRFSDLYDVLKNYPSSLEVQYMIEEALKTSFPLLPSNSLCFPSQNEVQKHPSASLHEGSRDHVRSSGGGEMLTVSTQSNPKGFFEGFAQQGQQGEWMNLFFQAKVEEEVRKVIQRSPHLFHLAQVPHRSESELDRPPLVPASTKNNKNGSAMQSLSSMPSPTEDISPVGKAGSSTPFGDAPTNTRTTLKAGGETQAPPPPHPSSTVWPPLLSIHSLRRSSTAAGGGSDDRHGKGDSNRREVGPLYLEGQLEQNAKADAVLSCKEERICALETSLQEVQARLARSEKNFQTLMEALVSLSLSSTNERKGWEVRAEQKGRYTEEMKGYTASTASRNERSITNQSNQKGEWTIGQEDSIENVLHFSEPQQKAHLSSSSSSPSASSSWPVYVSSSPLCPPDSTLSACLNAGATCVKPDYSQSTNLRTEREGERLHRWSRWRDALDQQDVPSLRLQLVHAFHSLFDWLRTTTDADEEPERRKEESRKEESKRERQMRPPLGVGDSFPFSLPSLEGGCEADHSKDSLEQPVKTFLEDKKKRIEKPQELNTYLIRLNSDTRTRQASRPFSTFEPRRHGETENGGKKFSPCLLEAKEFSTIVGAATGDRLFSSAAHTVSSPKKIIVERDAVGKASTSSTLTKSSSCSLTSPAMKKAGGGSSRPCSSLGLSEGYPVHNLLRENDHPQHTLISSSHYSSGGGRPATLPSSSEKYEGKGRNNLNRPQRSLGIHAVDVPRSFIGLCLTPRLGLVMGPKTVLEGQPSKQVTPRAAWNLRSTAEGGGAGGGGRRNSREQGRRSKRDDAKGIEEWNSWSEGEYSSEGILDGTDQGKDRPEADNLSSSGGGVRIVQVDAESVAEKAGLLPGDVILELAPFGPVHNCTMLAQIVRRHKDVLDCASMGYTASTRQEKGMGRTRSESPEDKLLVALVYRPMVPHLLHMKLRW